MSGDDHLEQLGRAFGFTLEQLHANQRGELHPLQRTWGMRRGLLSIVLLGAFAAAALAGGLIAAQAFADSLGSLPSQSDLNAVHLIRWAGCLLAFGFLAGAALAFARRRRRRAAFAAGRIDVLQGPLDKCHISGRGVPDRYIVRVGDRALDVYRAQWTLLTQGATYRLHFVADQLLSLAPVATDPHERAEYDREIAHFKRTRQIAASRWVG